MAKKENFFVRTCLLFIRLVTTLVVTILIFTLLLGFIVFRCMHSTGSHMLAAMLSNYPVVNIVPKLFFLPSELDRILEEHQSSSQSAEDADDAISAKQSELIISPVSSTDATAAESDDSLILVDGLYIRSKVDETVATATPAVPTPIEPDNP